ncbi:MAG: ABC transporter ATP-binding protein [Firmicutes bacterium]|nr:ABC transporter ATP-binding protein [Bacillota bacterium]
MAENRVEERTGTPGNNGSGRRGPGHRAAQMMPGEKAKNFGRAIKDLLRYLGPHKVKVTIVFIFAIASTVFSIVAPTVLGEATDVVVKGLMSDGVDFSALAKILIFLGALYGVSFVFSWAQGFIMAGVSQKVTYRLRADLSEKMDRMPLKFFDGRTHGEVQSRFINDIETVNQSLSQSITQALTSITTIVGILIMMIRISLLMTLVALVVIPLSVLVIRLVVSKSQGHFANQQKFLGEVNGHVEEMYTGHTIVQAFNKEEKSAEKFDEINDRLCESAWKSQFLSGLMMPATQLIGNLAYVGICILGGVLAINGKVSIGNIQAFIQYVRQFNQPLQQVANIVNMLQSTAAAAERVFEFLNEEEEEDAYNNKRETAPKARKDEEQKPAETAAATGQTEAAGTGAPKTGAGAPAETNGGLKGRIVFDHVSFGYDPAVPVLKDFSYSVEPGSRIAIVGPTGAGKTTIVKLLMRFYELGSGAIYIDDVNIRDMSRKDLRDKFGMVLQETWLFNGPVMENIRYGRMDATDEEVIAAARAARIHHFIMTQPGGYEMVINEDASNISQGQKQLLTIARAMLADSPILILDEATSSVDTRTEKLIYSAMEELMRGRTSFVIAHRLSTIRDADTILVLDNGDIVEHGTHEELLEKGGFYASLYNSQFA